MSSSEENMVSKLYAQDNSALTLFNRVAESASAEVITQYSTSFGMATNLLGNGTVLT